MITAKQLHEMRAKLSCARTDAMLVHVKAEREWGSDSSIALAAVRALAKLDEGIAEIDIEIAKAMR